MKTTKIIACVAVVTYLSAIRLPCTALGADEKPDLPFTSGSTGADGALILPALPPSFTPARDGLGLAYDAARQNVVLHGGNWNASASQGSLNDTWTWDGTNWKQVASSALALAYHSLAYDTARQQVLLFGGFTLPSFSVSRESYVWDGTTWIQKFPNTRPASRWLHAMAYNEARQRVVLFSGYNGNYYDDTWTWDGAEWTAAAPAHKPPPRSGHSLAYDAARQQIVLFGGNDNTGSMNDTWTWNDTDWVQMSPATSPPKRSGHAMAYDAARQKVVLFGGSNMDDTWLWDGTNWTLADPPTKPLARTGGAMAYDAARQQILLAGGRWERGELLNDVWAWDGTTWTMRSAGTYVFDMSSKPNGVWNFTTINIPVGFIVLFKNNAANTPVRWLATENVTINGTIDLSGEDGTPGAARSPAGGPGGFAGGLGGIPFDQSGSYAATPGQGPGGGTPGLGRFQAGANGKYASVYGNSYLQPLVGGSGGGGQGSENSSRYGSAGGGGGGAIMIASSRDMSINGGILANGGGIPPNIGGTGKGSGGAIRLQADRITVTGTLSAEPDGLIRAESYERQIPDSLTAKVIKSGPVQTKSFDTSPPVVLITSVAGQNVVQPPKGDLANPDVIFSDAGEVTVTVKAQTLPDGTPVRLRMTSRGTVVEKPAHGDPRIQLAGGTANFTLLVPKGAATLQAFADLVQ